MCLLRENERSALSASDTPQATALVSFHHYSNRPQKVTSDLPVSIINGPVSSSSSLILCAIYLDIPFLLEMLSNSGSYDTELLLDPKRLVTCLQTWQLLLLRHTVP